MRSHDISLVLRRMWRMVLLNCTDKCEIFLTTTAILYLNAFCDCHVRDLNLAYVNLMHIIWSLSNSLDGFLPLDPSVGGGGLCYLHIKVITNSFYCMWFSSWSSCSLEPGVTRQSRSIMVP